MLLEARCDSEALQPGGEPFHVLLTLSLRPTSARQSAVSGADGTILVPLEAPRPLVVVQPFVSPAVERAGAPLQGELPVVLVLADGTNTVPAASMGIFVPLVVVEVVSVRLECQLRLDGSRFQIPTSGLFAAEQLVPPSGDGEKGASTATLFHCEADAPTDRQHTVKPTDPLQLCFCATLPPRAPPTHNGACCRLRYTLSVACRWRCVLDAESSTLLASQTQRLVMPLTVVRADAAGPVQLSLRERHLRHGFRASVRPVLRDSAAAGPTVSLAPLAPAPSAKLRQLLLQARAGSAARRSVVAAPPSAAAPDALPLEVPIMHGGAAVGTMLLSSTELKIGSVWRASFVPAPADKGDGTTKRPLGQPRFGCALVSFAFERVEGIASSCVRPEVPAPSPWIVTERSTQFEMQLLTLDESASASHVAAASTADAYIHPAQFPPSLHTDVVRVDWALRCTFYLVELAAASLETLTRPTLETVAEQRVATQVRLFRQCNLPVQATEIVVPLTVCSA